MKTNSARIIFLNFQIVVLYVFYLKFYLLYIYVQILFIAGHPALRSFMTRKPH